MFEAIPKLRIFMKSLLILQIFIGLTITTVTWCSQRILSTFLIEAEGKVLTSKFFNVYILGFQLVASFLSGISMWARVWPRRYSENVQLLLSMWLIFCFLIIVCGCATTWMLLATADTLSEAAEIILLKGIDIYYMNPEWKLLWDKLQYTRECCGVHGYEDWMHATWMQENIKYYRDTRDYEPLQAAITECAPTYGDYERDDPEPLPTQMPVESNQIMAPYACCKHNSTFCYESYMPHTKRDGHPSRLPHLNLTDINTQGCLPLFTHYLTIALHILFILILVAVVINFIICCCSKYLMATNYRRSYREFDNDSCLFDDEGNALVIIKCPPNVRCITLEEPNTYSGSDIPNVASSVEFCPCCNGNNETTGDLEHRLKANKTNKASLVH